MPLVFAMNKAPPLTVSLRDWVVATHALPLDQDKAEVRILATLVTAGFMVLIAEPLFYLFLVPASLVARVAGMALSPYLVAMAFAAALIMTLPHFFALLFRPRKLYVTWPRRLAARGSLVAAAAWMYLVALAVPLDVGAVEWAYGMRVVFCLLVGGTYGISLNAQQLREVLNAKAP